MAETRIAVVRTKGRANIRKEIETAFRLLRLHRKNYSVIVAKNPETEGMLRKVKDFTARREVREEDIARAKLPESRFYRHNIITLIGKAGGEKKK
ncbi:uL30 family ribosomal protein [Candidatus Woesearchaeota archaeon]|nr:uL30 family ribosomal protein [Candidatus Woesearchaeota archaeon]